MRILIVAAWYAPLFHPRAHRWTALAEYWAAQGHQVTVLCCRQPGCPDQEMRHGVQVLRTGYDSLYSKLFFSEKTTQPRAAGGLFSSLLQTLYRRIWKPLAWPDDALFWRAPAEKKALELLDNQPFDLLLTVSMPFTAHLIGLGLKRRFPKLPWLADVGDPYAVSPGFLFFKKAKMRLEKAVFARADRIVVTNAPMQETYQEISGSEVIGKIQVIPPLLHPVPEENAVKGPFFQEGIRMVFAGAVYAPHRPLAPLIELMQRWLADFPALRSTLQIDWYGPLTPDQQVLIKKMPCIRWQGYQSREMVREALEQADVLLHLGNTTPYQLPSKVVEYLAAGRPVLHLCLIHPDPTADFLLQHGHVWVALPGAALPAPERLLTWAAAGANKRSEIQAFTVASLSEQYLEPFKKA